MKIVRSFDSDTIVLFAADSGAEVREKGSRVALSVLPVRSKAAAPGVGSIDWSSIIAPLDGGEHTDRGVQHSSQCSIVLGSFDPLLPGRGRACQHAVCVGGVRFQPAYLTPSSERADGRSILVGVTTSRYGLSSLMCSAPRPAGVRWYWITDRAISHFRRKNHAVVLQILRGPPLRRSSETRWLHNTTALYTMFHRTARPPWAT
ncbi:allantoate permease, putative [Anopheles sinensis]|uniref:Allantoate permease, putative n=1 Tax=Anopheles sinensis TaxID=74873 RepID=A0A084W7Y7_ANOSI|nr:allantoate permease, putative [Anopheles sinensis]